MFSKWMATACLLLCLSPVPALSADTGPMAQIEQTVEQVIDTLKDDTIKGEQQRQRLTELIKARFDFQAMSQWVLGPYWKKADADERETFMELFSELLEANYLGRIESYTDEEVRFVSEKIDGRRAEVETLIITDSAEIPISYKLVDRQGQWLVYDVIVEKVSLVRNYRGTYTEIARKEGMEGLFEQMRNKIGELKNRPKEA
ncbi:MAG: phospholipid-binding protein MlaC [Geoalkalibacter sp.]|jgi:phospholipid transport system substrate-binding protein|uniref:MlaC/ttg2D family ABC transporter substrate-binding protein n=1 Tax=Geoalkalibacter sp. TaxID=3041440 RepID=UPI002A935DB0|nr:ABC transporter substrate-binding protein [Thermodesulfobacteriota bacterium]